MNKILIINVNWLGDVLFTTPAIRAIKKAYPNSFLACMVVPRVKEVLENNPYIDELIIFDEKTIHRSPFAKLKFIFELKKKKFDTALLFHRSFTRTLICFLAGIRDRFGYYTGKRASLLTKNLLCTERDKLHRVDYFLNLLKLINIDKVEDKTYDFNFSEKDRQSVKEILRKNAIKEGDLIVVAHAAANWEPKRWPVNHFAKLLDKLTKEMNAKIILTGAKKDSSVVNTVSNLMINQPINLCGRLSLAQLGALMKEADLVISADSGPLHIAAAVQAKNVIALFGPTLPEITGPIAKNKVLILQKKLGCPLPCYVTTCQDNRCMKEILPEEVFLAAKELLKNAPRT